jgi:hypothetical protein
VRRRCALAGESRVAAFTSGDLPEAPGGGGFFLSEGAAALIRFGMAPGNYFPPPPQVFVYRATRDRICEEGRLCSAKQNSCPAAILRCAPALRVRNRLRLRPRDRREGRDERG